MTPRVCPPHTWVTAPDGVDRCADCEITFLEHVRGVNVAQRNFEMPSKSFRHKRLVEGLGGESAK